MAHNYYQQPQYYQPQNIYQQLGAQQPQQQGGPQIQQRLGFAQGQQQPQSLSLVQQRLQSLQQQATQNGYPFQQQSALSGPLQIQQRPPTGHPGQQQLVQYQAPPPQQVQAQPSPQQNQYPYSKSAPQPVIDSRSIPQQPQSSGVPWSAQRRPLPQPRPGSTSPTRSRPLPAPTPGPYSSKVDATPTANAKPASSPWTRTPSPTKPTASTTEPPKRGRTSPPKFSVASISPSNIASSASSSPSPPSSVSSLSQDSFSGSPALASRAAPIPDARSGPPSSSSAFAPSSSLARLKSELSGDSKSIPKALIPGQKVVPVWKRTLPDVLPPLLPTPPPNAVQQQAHLQRQQPQTQVHPQPSQWQPPPQTQVQPQPSQRSQRSQPPQFHPSRQRPVQQKHNRRAQQSAQFDPPPPIPSHTKPRPRQPTASTVHSGATQHQEQWSYPHNEEDEDDSEDEDEDEDEEDEEEEEEEEEEQTEYTTDSEPESPSTNTDMGIVPPSPQYGIRDLPARHVPPHPGPMPQPPARVGGGGPRAITSSSGFGSGSGFQAGWSKQERGAQSMTMRFAASGASDSSGSESGSAVGLPRPPMMGMGGANQSTPTKWGHELNLDDTPPPRAAFVLQRGQGGSASSPLPVGQTISQAQGRRALPIHAEQPQPQETPPQAAQRRPQSQIYSPTTPRQQAAARPQSQIYQSPLKQVDGNSGASQAPVGGRDRRANIERMESESDHEREHEHIVHSPVPVPLINIHPEGEEDDDEEDQGPPIINIQEVPQINVQETPQINVQYVPPQINVNGAGKVPKAKVYENFAPKCYSCKTPIYEERFISLDDPALGKRAYHEQHFFCAECGDPFLAPSIGEQSSRTGAFIAVLFISESLN
ncbi:hypothetical protein C0991_010512 [Blastosporella zonata]|nr:hypothetical protein C0991_010512 [Blastosporella zonata]